MYGYGNSMFLATHGILARSASGGGVDPDAQAFITAASITNPTQQSAINQLVVDLKGYNIWTKFKAIYPIVGGTSSTHKWNLKDPRDLDAAFRLTFANGWTHSANGMTPTNAYADTKINLNTLIQNDTHLSYYSRTNNTTINIDMGQTAANPANAYTYLSHYGGVSKGVGVVNSINGNYVAESTYTNSQGLLLATRNSYPNVRLFRNTTKTESNVSYSINIFESGNIYLGARNDLSVGPANYSNRQCAFASIGSNLTDTEVANFYTAVQAYQTTLGRQV